MDSLLFLALYYEAIGEGEDLLLFSRMRICERFELTLYHGAKLIRSLQNAGLLIRVGNQYRLNKVGMSVATSLGNRRQELITK